MQVQKLLGILKETMNTAWVLVNNLRELGKVIIKDVINAGYDSFMTINEESRNTSNRNMESNGHEGDKYYMHGLENIVLIAKAFIRSNASANKSIFDENKYEKQFRRHEK